MNQEFLRLMQRRIGSTSVSASTARGMGPKGTIAAARAYLQSMDLARFAVASEEAFLTQLDAATTELRDALPRGARKWGSARKFLNIFLRGCFYNRYLCEQYALQRLEPWLELPLDSHVAAGLRSSDRLGRLPKWRSVISLTKGDSEKLQTFARQRASEEGIARVHLDLRYWRPEPQEVTSRVVNSRRTSVAEPLQESSASG